MPVRSRLLVLAMDIGSSSVRTAFFTDAGTRLLPSTSTVNYALRYTDDGGAELDAEALLRAARSCVFKSLLCRRRSPDFRDAPIIAVSGSAFWHSLLALGRAGKPISPIFTWADSRGVADAVRLRGELSEAKIHARTGCMIRAPFWPAKLRWLRRTRPRFKRAKRWVSPGAWIFRALFGVDATSHSMASGTGLYNLRTASWDHELCGLCDVRPDQLGPLSDHAEAFEPAHVELTGVPVFSAMGDGAASNLGSGADLAGRIAITVGTSAAARLVASNKSQRIPFGLFKYAVDEDRVVIGGATSNGGNLRQWIRRELKIPIGRETEVLSRTSAADDALTILPFWVSERAPTWPENLRGSIIGLTAASTAADILRAATTSTFYRLAEILARLDVSARTEIIVSGGILHSLPSLKILADSIAHDIRIYGEPEASLRGAAVLALEKLGIQPPRLRPGKLVRHNAALARKHQARRKLQSELERRLS
ncbi:MAG: gluconokinase [Chthoniobacterales bacterium]